MGGRGAKSATSKAGGASKGRITAAKLDVYDITDKEYRRIATLNKKNNWSITERALKRLGTQYQKAAKKGDIHTMVYIEERLMDINYRPAIREFRKKAGITDTTW